MSDTNELFPAIEIRDAIGMLADGHEVDPRLMPFIRAAVTGLCPTADRGDQQFVVAVDAAHLFNVDTEELIWPIGPEEESSDNVPLRALTQPELWEQSRRRWEDEHPRAWTAFVWRVAVPLINRLGIVGAWR